MRVGKFRKLIVLTITVEKGEISEHMVGVHMDGRRREGLVRSMQAVYQIYCLQVCSRESWRGTECYLAILAQQNIQ